MKAAGARESSGRPGGRSPLFSRVVAILLPVALMLAYAPFAAAAPADLDPAFSGDGLAMTDASSGPSRANGVIRQPDGKLVVAGRSDGRRGEFAIARYNSDGSLDSSFSSDGRQTTDFGGFGGGSAAALALQSNGKIVAVGTDGSGFAVARYNSDGSLDTSFSGDGRESVDLGGFGGSGAAVALQADGKIVAAGSDSGGFAVVRFDSDGSLDDTFSTDGVTDAGSGGQARGMAVQADGKIVVVGAENGDFVATRYTADGSLDNGFSGDGTQSTDLGSSGDEAAAVAIQSDGKIVAAGSNGNFFTATSDFALVRYNPDGSLDNGFSGDGKQTTDFDGDYDFGAGVAVQGDGKIVAVGAAGAGGTDFGVTRYNANGSLDASFSGDGKQRTSLGTGSAEATGVAVQSDGKVVAVGSADSDNDFALARYGTNGSLDATFSGDGLQTTQFSGADEGGAVKVQPDGKVLVAGLVRAHSGGGDIAVARYKPDGSLDTSFSGDGLQTVGFSFGSEGVVPERSPDIAVQPDGKIVVVGADGAFAVARLTADGSLDTSFSGDGRQRTEFGDSAGADGVALQGDGKIVVVGSADAGTGGGSDVALARYNADGSLDTGFSGDGKQTTDFAGDSYVEEARDVAIQSDGKIVSAGVSAGGFAASRYNTNGSLDTSFSGDGKQTTQFGGALDGASSVALQADGKLVAAGGNGSGDFALVRYTANGSLDTSFAGDGTQTTDIGSGGSPQLERAYGVAIQNDGRIVAVGSNGGLFAAVRYNATGQLDSSFSGDGIRTGSFGGGNDAAADVAIQGDGKLVVAGTATNESEDFGVARFQGGSGPADTTAPNTTISSGPSGATTDRTPTFAFTSSEAGSTFECRVDSGSFTACSSPRTTSSLPNGAHTFYVRATDAAGNTDSTPASRSFTVSVSNPATPSKPKPKPKPTPKPKPKPTTKIPSIGGAKSAGTLRVSSKGKVTLPKPKVDCSGAGSDCTVKTSVTGPPPPQGKKASSSAKKKRVKLGSSSFEVKAGKTGKVKVKLTKKGLKRLKRLGKIKAKVKITVERGSKVTTKTVKVTLKRPKRPKKK